MLTPEQQMAAIGALADKLNSTMGTPLDNTTGKVLLAKRYEGRIKVIGIRPAQDVNSSEEFAAQEQIGIFYSIEKSLPNGTTVWVDRNYTTLFDNQDTDEFKVCETQLKTIKEVSDKLVEDDTFIIDYAEVGYIIYPEKYWIPAKGSITKKNPKGTQRKNKAGEIVGSNEDTVFRGKQGPSLQQRIRGQVASRKSHFLSEGTGANYVDTAGDGPEEKKTPATAE